MSARVETGSGQGQGRDGKVTLPEAHGSVSGYVTGFLLSAILTVIPFWLMMSGALGNTLVTTIAILTLGVAQIVVHMVFFLHMNTRSEGGWTFIAFVFTLILVVVTLVGSIWVMYHMDGNMMPMTPHQARTQP